MTSDERPAPSDAAAEAVAQKRWEQTRELAIGDPEWSGLDEETRDDYRHEARILLAAALPLLHAQWAAVVDAALRNRERYQAWAEAEAVGLGWRPGALASGPVADTLADNMARYLADTLGAKPEETPDV